MEFLQKPDVKKKKLLVLGWLVIKLVLGKL
jgi:hypothetical protein